MIPINELTPAAAVYANRRKTDPIDNSLAVLAFGRLFGAYGSLWSDKWRTGVLDKSGRDAGVQSAMTEWSAALAPFTREAVDAACDAMTQFGRSSGDASASTARMF